MGTTTGFRRPISVILSRQLRTTLWRVKLSSDQRPARLGRLVAIMNLQAGHPNSLETSHHSKPTVFYIWIRDDKHDGNTIVLRTVCCNRWYTNRHTRMPIKLENWYANSTPVNQWEIHTYLQATLPSMNTLPSKKMASPPRKDTITISWFKASSWTALPPIFGSSARPKCSQPWKVRRASLGHLELSPCSGNSNRCSKIIISFGESDFE